MIINLWIDFLVEFVKFEPVVMILACMLAVCSVLLIRCLKVW